MRRMKRSLGHAINGMTHAFEREKNLRVFLYWFILVIAAGFYVGLIGWEWLTLVIAAGAFVISELLNTAIERFVDVVDHMRRSESGGFHANLKAAKDVAAAASLAALIVNIVVIVMVFWPYAMMEIKTLMQ